MPPSLRDSGRAVPSLRPEGMQQTTTSNPWQDSPFEVSTPWGQVTSVHSERNAGHGQHEPERESVRARRDGELHAGLGRQSHAKRALGLHVRRGEPAGDDENAGGHRRAGAAIGVRV